MADLTWPSGLSPFRMTFYLQPHVGGAESPLTRTRKVYTLSAPRWVCKLSFRGVASEIDHPAALVPPLLDSLIIQMAGGANRMALWDFRRPYPIGLRKYYQGFAGQRFTFTGGEDFTGGERFAISGTPEPLNDVADQGASSMVFKGFKPGQRPFQTGDYFGGDGRTHLIHSSTVADAGGRTTVTFDPPLASAIGSGRAVTMKPTSLFRLSGEDAGQNDEEIGQASVYALEFTEDLT
ncbi:hypothetical protein KFK14_17700 [Sphingobium phenoxybenzoativorans]|uniref:Uncharacterized protein n=1 Tax=Sphingobium phenoxybenzoativorans TaxID=1592790 RepID=A0A975K5H4_9SPHN|nr:hypothetical protein [Sphingobium phenoxybenzoativorans]QUT04847.1 hypothetical protein KFK14_17700 [Sphingobium phenoxybenzoativorans]